MKSKILALAMLSVVGWAASATDARAFGLFPCFHRGYSVIICRPYNAFTPMCYGNIVCDGCCPTLSCNSCGFVPGAPIQSCLPMMCSNGSCEALPAATGPAKSVPAPGQAAPMPMPMGPTFTPPMPTPAPNQTSMYWNPQAYGVQTAGYNPGYYPTYPMNYNPYYNYPMVPSVPAPYYWYNGR